MDSPDGDERQRGDFELIERVTHRFDAEGIGMPYSHRQSVGSLDATSSGERAAPSDD